MTPTSPYLLRAIYQWILDNDCTPHLLVDATGNDLTVPQDFVKEGSIVLNIAPGAVRDLDFGNDYILFSARFAGVSQDITVPVSAVRAIYAKENGQGILLAEEKGADKAPDTQQPEGACSNPPHLTIVK